MPRRYAAAAAAAAQIDAEMGMSNASLGSDLDMDDELLDIPLAGADRELEEKRAQEMRERAMKAEAEARNSGACNIPRPQARAVGRQRQTRGVAREERGASAQVGGVAGDAKTQDASDGANEESKSGTATRSLTLQT